MAPSNPFGSTAPRADAVQVTPWGEATAPSMSGPAEGTEPREYRLPGGKLEALSELMARQDVPIWIERGAGKIVVHATPEQHEVFGAFVKLINPDGSTGDGASAGGLTRTLSTLLGRVRGDRPNADALRAHLESLTSQREAHEERLDTLRERAERIREQAERFREMAEELREKAGEADGDLSRDAFRRAEQELSLQGNGLETQAVDLEAQLSFFESQVESLESAIESMEEQIEAIDESEMAAITTEVAPDVVSAGDLFLTAPVDVVAPAEGDDMDSDEDADEDSDEDSEVDLVIPADVLDEAAAPQPAPAPSAPTTPSSLR